MPLVSCYPNTVLQYLFHIKSLTIDFIENKNKFYKIPIEEAYPPIVLGLINENIRRNVIESIES